MAIVIDLQGEYIANALRLTIWDLPHLICILNSLMVNPIITQRSSEHMIGALCIGDAERHHANFYFLKLTFCGYKSRK